MIIGCQFSELYHNPIRRRCLAVNLCFTEGDAVLFPLQLLSLRVAKTIQNHLGQAPASEDREIAPSFASI